MDRRNIRLLPLETVIVYRRALGFYCGEFVSHMGPTFTSVYPPLYILHLARENLKDITTNHEEFLCLLLLAATRS